MANASSLTCALLAMAAGIWAFIETQRATKELFDPILAACTTSYDSMEDFVAATGYRAYDTRVGLKVLDPLVCLMVQFLHMLTQHNGGLVVWVMTMISALPAGLLTWNEGGRSGNAGPLMWPATLNMLYLVLGISVVFPAVWVPAYVYGRSEGIISKAHIWLVLPLNAIPLVVFSFLVFHLDPSSEDWTLIASILASPAVSLATGLFLWSAVPAPKPSLDAEIIRSANTVAMSFAITGAIALFGWVYLVFLVWNDYGTDYETLCNDLWTDAHPAVKFMTIDAVVLWLGLILHVSSKRLSSGVEALLLTPVFGPGAACSMSLAALEVDLAPKDTTSSVDTTEKKEK